LRIVRISELEDSLVIHFSVSDQRINAYTLATTLVGFADAAKAANSSINHGHEIEIVVEALGPGSFRAKIRAVYRKSKNLFSNQALQSIVLGIISSFIYERTLAKHDDVRVVVQTNEVIIEHGEDRIVVPRGTYDATRIAEKNPQFVRGMGRALDSISRDERISSIGFVPDMTSPEPSLLIPRDSLPTIDPSIRDEPPIRLVEEECELQIVKAILERGDRKWEFMWRGVKISAPVSDDSFYSDFFAHRITIAPGDELRVRLAITQIRDSETGIYTNTRYEVLEVRGHVPRMKQMNFTAEAGAE
jgi:hypothetical protein